MPRRVLLLAALAYAIALAYAVYLQPEWEPLRDDQFEYLALARRLGAQAEFSRAAAGEAFVAEWLRAPGYPLFLAPLCRLSGCAHWHVALAGAALFAALVPLAYLLARPIVGQRVAVAGAAATALYLPFAYYAVLPLSDVLAATLAAVALLLAPRALGGGAPWSLAAGAALGLLALTRPLFLLLPALFAPLLLTRWAARGKGSARPGRLLLARRGVGHAALLALAFVAIAGPLVAYDLFHFGRPLVGNAGTLLFLGYFQGRTAGSLAEQERFRAVALAQSDAAALAAAAAPLGLDVYESAEAAAAWREIDAFGVAAVGADRGRAWLALDDALGRRARALIAHDPAGYALRRATVGVVELLASDVPVRYATVSSVPLAARAATLATQLLIAAAAIVGLARWLRRGGLAAALAVAFVAYVVLLSLPFQTEPRYALPARPLLLVAAVDALALLAARRVAR